MSYRIPRRWMFLLAGSVMTVLGIGLFYITTIAHEDGPKAVAFIGGGTDAVATFDGITIQANTAIYASDPQGAAHAREYCGMNVPGQTLPWNILQLSIGGGPSNVCLRQGQSQPFGRVIIRIEQVGQVQARRYDGSPIALSRVALSMSRTWVDNIEEAGAALMLGLGPALLGAAAVADGTPPEPPGPAGPAGPASPVIGHDLAGTGIRRHSKRRIVHAVSGRKALIVAGVVATSLAVVAGSMAVAATNAGTPGSSTGVRSPAGAVRVAVTFPGRATPPAAVPQMVTVQGTSSNLGPGQKIWVFTRNPGDTRLNPQPQAAVLSADGSWRSQTFVGSPGDAGKSFQILVAVADAAAAAAITGYLATAHQTGQYPGLPALPAGARLYDQVSVIRGNVAHYAAI